MNESGNDVSLYDQTCRQLRLIVADRLPAAVDAEHLLTAYAYWVCWRVRRRGADWEETLREYAALACRRAADESEAERREIALLRRELARAHGPLLDVGAGWGRMASLYAELGLPAVYAEPEVLGTRLMRRSGLRQAVRSVGEALPFASATFAASVIGWVLHHDAPDLDAAGIVREAARVVAPGGRLLSIEPLGERFGQEEWTRLLSGAGFEVSSIERFFEMKDSHGKAEHYAMAVGTRRS
jgi:SAM-dependent methyltransferase